MKWQRVTARLADLLRRPAFSLEGGLVHAAEILAWQLVAKMISVVAFGRAAQVLGPDKLGISAIVLGVAMQLAALSALINEAYLTRKFRRLPSRRGRQQLISAGFGGRVIGGLILVIPAVSIGLIVAPRVWGLSIVAGGLLVLLAFLQPGWLLVAQDRTNLIWRTTGLGSLAASACYFAFRGDLPAGSDAVVQALGLFIFVLLGWWLALRHGRWSLAFKMKDVFLSGAIAYRSRWLAISYLLAHIYLYSDLFWLGFLGSPTEAGVYRPASNLGMAFHQMMSFVPLLLYPRLLDWANDPARLAKRQFGIVLAILGVSAAVAAIAFLTCQPLFRFLYGREFLAGSFPFAVLVTSRCIGIASSVFIWGLIAANRDRAAAMAYACGTAVSLVANFALIPRFGLWGCAIAALACDMTLLAVSWVLARRPRAAGVKGK